MRETPIEYTRKASRAREPLMQPSLSLSQLVRNIGIRKLTRQGFGRRIIETISRRELMKTSTYREYERRIEEYVRRRQRPKRSLYLTQDAFSQGKGPLADTTAPPAEQVSRMNLFWGAIGSYKNPQSHRDVTRLVMAQRRSALTHCNFDRLHGFERGVIKIGAHVSGPCSFQYASMEQFLGERDRCCAATGVHMLCIATSTAT
jgi:hypothetical protein